VRVICTSFFILALGIGAAWADPPDPNIDPVLPDPKSNNAYFPPSSATQGVADPGSLLNTMPVSNAVLAGHGAGCSARNPCAVNSPPTDHVVPAWPPSAAAPGKNAKRVQAAKLQAGKSAAPSP
jgi:hypothetical protein